MRVRPYDYKHTYMEGDYCGCCYLTGKEIRVFDWPCWGRMLPNKLMSPRLLLDICASLQAVGECFR